MATTLLLSTQKLQPVYNDMVCVLSSTNYAQTNFLMRAEINIVGATVSTIKQQSNIQNYNIFDIHKHIEPYITYDLDHANTASFRAIPNSFEDYDVYFFEEFTSKTNGATITSIGDNGGGTAQVTTLANHGYTTGQTIGISAASVSAHNGL